MIKPRSPRLNIFEVYSMYHRGRARLTATADTVHCRPPTLDIIHLYYYTTHDNITRALCIMTTVVPCVVINCLR